MKYDPHNCKAAYCRVCETPSRIEGVSAVQLCRFVCNLHAQCNNTLQFFASLFFPIAAVWDAASAVEHALLLPSRQSRALLLSVRQRPIHPLHLAGGLCVLPRCVGVRCLAQTTAACSALLRARSPCWRSGPRLPFSSPPCRWFGAWTTASGSDPRLAGAPGRLAVTLTVDTMFATKPRSRCVPRRASPSAPGVCVCHTIKHAWGPPRYYCDAPHIWCWRPTPPTKSAAAAMLSNGMHGLGYDHVILDDCWALDRDPDTQEITWDPTRFPSGIPALASWLADRGLKLGLCTYGRVQCCRPRLSTRGGSGALPAGGCWCRRSGPHRECHRWRLLTAASR